MIRAIVVVAAILLGLAYSAFFLMWNVGERANLIMTPKIGTHPYWIGDIPVGLLPIVGAVIGALVMAVAAWLPWAGQRATIKAQEARIQKIMDKFNEQKGILKARNERIAQLEDELEALEAQAVGAVPAEAVGGEELLLEVLEGGTDAEDEADDETII